MLDLGGINGVTKVTLDSVQGTQGTKPAGGPAFGNALKEALEGVNKSQREAENLSHAYQLEDPNAGLEETMIAMSKANINFQALVQVRNRLVSAYHDIMNMQI
jgi:flagellar hook-basal body complex protein FliE